MKNQVESSRHNLWLFFLIAYAFSWLVWTPSVLVNAGFLDPPSFFFIPILDQLATFGPFVAAVSLTYWYEGKEAVKELLKRGVDYNFRKIWFIPILLLMPAIYGGSLLLSILTDRIIPDLVLFSAPLLLVGTFFFVMFIGGPLGEEFGWRGYALDGLQERYNALTSSIIVGVLWGFWHLPGFTGPGWQFSGLGVWLFIVGIILFSILLTWLVNNTNGSILTAILFHTMINFSVILFQIYETNLGGLFAFIASIVITLLVVLVWRPNKLVREKST
jgi:membrane protease YdiL (CAAX protease family)